MRRDFKLRAVDVALSTSAAPAYFPAHEIDGDAALIDGGDWANCPALVGVVEAITTLNVKRTDIDVLSVGTTDEPFDIPPARRTGGSARWARQAAGLLMRASEVGALAQAELLTRRLCRWDGLLRLNPPVRPGRFRMDSPARVRDLIALGKKSAEHHAELVLARFLQHPAEPFVPVYSLDSVEA